MTQLDVLLEPRFITSREAIENLIESKLHFSYSLAQATGQRWSTLEYRVTGQFATAALRQRAAAIRAGKRDRNVQLVLDVLCHAGVIPAGRYSFRDTLPTPVAGPAWTAGSLRVTGVAI